MNSPVLINPRSIVAARDAWELALSLTTVVVRPATSATVAAVAVAPTASIAATAAVTRVAEGPLLLVLLALVPVELATAAATRLLQGGQLVVLGSKLTF